jgi:flagellar basal body-associated protein FliL
MATEPAAANSRPKASEESAPTPAAPAKGTALWKRLPLGTWIAVLLGLSVIVHGFAFLYYQISAKTANHALAAEVPLGEFHFVSEKAEPGSIGSAEFGLYVTLLDHIDRQAREQLAARRFRIQQDIEQLLRQSHAHDFADPTLGDVKRQLQEQINGSLEMRAIADVIITDLKLTRTPREEGAATRSAATTAAQEGPLGTAQAANAHAGH